jgi:hypothetical protein
VGFSGFQWVRTWPRPASTHPQLLNIIAHRNLSWVGLWLVGPPEALVPSPRGVERNGTIPFQNGTPLVHTNFVGIFVGKPAEQPSLPQPPPARDWGCGYGQTEAPVAATLELWQATLNSPRPKIRQI